MSYKLFTFHGVKVGEFETMQQMGDYIYNEVEYTEIPKLYAKDVRIVAYPYNTFKYTCHCLEIKPHANFSSVSQLLGVKS